MNVKSNRKITKLCNNEIPSEEVAEITENEIEYKLVSGDPVIIKSPIQDLTI